MENKIAVVFFLLILAACSGDNGNDTKTGNDSSIVKPGIIFDKPSRMQPFALGDSIEISLRVALPDFKYDSVTVSFSQKNEIQRLSGMSGKVKILASTTGMQPVRIHIHTADSVFSETQVIVCYSDIKPVLYQYKVLKKYKHNPDDYTQGLVYDKGFVYEGTGQPKQSQLKKYRLETGDLIQSYKMPDEDFGEGIVLYKDFIYQLTWQSGVAYKYEKESFKMINRFVVQTEGWGITNYTDKLIMSDGSNILYVLSPESFDVIRRIEVYDNVGPVNNLNELEYIGGKIFANIYTTDFIVIIDTESGRVEGKINMEGLIKQCDNTKDTDVLNGIAWMGEENRILVTGKWWPNIFYIEFFR
jgi:glutamine cyclotransferase